jgi:hypothetical protein
VSNRRELHVSRMAANSVSSELCFAGISSAGATNPAHLAVFELSSPADPTRTQLSSFDRTRRFCGAAAACSRTTTRSPCRPRWLTTVAYQAQICSLVPAFSLFASFVLAFLPGSPFRPVTSPCDCRPPARSLAAPRSRSWLVRIYFLLAGTAKKTVSDLVCFVWRHCEPPDFRGHR